MPSAAVTSAVKGESWTRRRFVAAVILGILTASIGCAQTRFLQVRPVPKNPLEGPLELLSWSGPKPSARTEQLLRRFALLAPQDDPEKTLEQLSGELQREASADKVYSYAELSFLAAKRAEKTGKDGLALDHYAASVAHAYLFLFSPQYDRGRNPYDPQFRTACDLYNGALEGSLRLANKRGALKPGKAEVITTGKQRYQVNVVVRGPWRAEEIERLEFTSDYEVQGSLKNQHHTYGLGVPMIAVRKKLETPIDQAEPYYPPGLSFATTAFLRVMPPAQDQSNAEVRQCTLELRDPLDTSDIQVSGRLVPLETDLTIPLAYYLDSPEFKKRDNPTLGLLNPDAAKEVEGLFMLEPYDPRRIPVVMAHGLWSSPTTWMEMFNDLRAFPEVRSRYQFWFFQYPTGKPFWENAAKMRETLEEVRHSIDPERTNPMLDEMILVGHSMGGLVSRMQTIESGDDFWKIVSDHPPSELKTDETTRQSLERLLYFHANRSVKRVVTIGTPHRGSDFANDYTRWAGRKLITMPEMMLNLTNELTRTNPGYFRDHSFIGCGTSIDSLAPESPIFPVLARAQRAPWVKYHNVVGIVPKNQFIGRLASNSDGIVAYESGHLPEAVSELKIEADHLTVHRTPAATLEVRRILMEHWMESGEAVAAAYLGAEAAAEMVRNPEPMRNVLR